MLSLIYAFRSTTVVLGIAAFASLLNRTMANSGVNEYLLAHQLGHLANAIGVFTYAFSVLVIAYFYAGSIGETCFQNDLIGLNLACVLLSD
jgi:hypothetical protein